MGGLIPGAEGHVRLALGLYVLGRLDPPERGMVEGHLLECGQCRADHDYLAGGAAQLATVSTEEWRRLLG